VWKLSHELVEPLLFSFWNDVGDPFFQFYLSELVIYFVKIIIFVKYKPLNTSEMSSYRQILYHLVFRTKNSQKVINFEHKEDLFRYIGGVSNNKKCFLYRINGMEEHIHILSDLHPSIALADYIRDIKTATSIWMKESGNFPGFVGWADGYAALTYAQRDKEMIINYIKNQHEHHKTISFEEEYRMMLKEFGIEIDERYFLK
jgi:putative transposase